MIAPYSEPRSNREISEVEVQRIALSPASVSYPTQDGTYASKPLVDWRGTPLYAELAILEMMKEDGWQGVWVDSFHQQYLTSMPGAARNVSLPDDIREQIDAIRAVYNAMTGSKSVFGGCWDVLCWKDDQLMFIELKRRSKDRIQQTQVAWLQAALACGKTLRSFRIVEWNLAAA